MLGFGSAPFRSLALAAMLTLALGAPVRADDGVKTPQAIARAAFPSVVMVMLREEGTDRNSLGSGFFVGEGLVATNFHVIAGMNTGFVRVIGQERQLAIAGVVATDRAHDLAILKLAEPGGAPLPLGRVEDLSIADKVYAIGNPHGLEGTFTEGLLSSIRRLDRETMLQISAPISQGSSGGPVFDDHGRVVGVAVGMLKDGQNLNFAIPVSYLQALLERTTDPVPLAEAAVEGAGPPRMPMGGLPPEAREDEEAYPEPEAPLVAAPSLPEALPEAPGPARPGLTPIDCGAFTCQLPPGWSLERNDSQSAAFSAARRRGGFALLTVFYKGKAHGDVDDYAGAAIAGLGQQYLKHRVTELAGERAYLILYKTKVEAGPVLASDLRVIHEDTEYTISLWSDADASDMRAIGADFDALAQSWRWK